MDQTKEGGIMEYQIPCDQCDITEDESKLIETFDNQLLCSSCYVKQEFKIESEDQWLLIYLAKK